MESEVRLYVYRLVYLSVCRPVCLSYMFRVCWPEVRIEVWSACMTNGRPARAALEARSTTLFFSFYRRSIHVCMSAVWARGAALSTYATFIFSFCMYVCCMGRRCRSIHECMSCGLFVCVFDVGVNVYIHALHQTGNRPLA